MDWVKLITERARVSGVLRVDELVLLDWVYLGRQEGSTIHTDELDLQRLDRSKLLQYAAKFPVPVKQQVLEAVATFNAVQSGMQ